MMKLREKLGATPHFQELDLAELDVLAAAMELVEAKDGEVIIREGERGDGCYFIVDGAVGVSHERDDEEIPIRELQPGELFGLVSLLDDGVRSASCRAVGPTKLGFLTSAAFTMLHDGNPALVLHFQKMVARQLAHDARALNASLVKAMCSSDGEGDGPGSSLSGELHLGSDD